MRYRAACLQGGRPVVLAEMPPKAEHSKLGRKALAKRWSGK
jgi:hypothetical protein